MAGNGSFSDLKLIGVSLADGIVLERASDGSVVTNVPHLVVGHSPTDFEFGFSGGGPADLALNIVEVVLRRRGYQGEKIRCFDGWCFALARHLCYDFMWKFVAVIPSEGAVIPYEAIEAWIKERMGKDGQDAD